MPMERDMQVSTRLSPDRRPGRDILLRATEDLTPTQVARRDLARYYALLERAAMSLRGRFSPVELEAIAYALASMAQVATPELLYLAPATVEEAVRYERICDQVGLTPEECDLLLRVRALDLAQSYALVDAVGRYLALPREKRGEEGWKEVGLL